jgi:hypothetical protein
VDKNFNCAGGEQDVVKALEARVWDLEQRANAMWSVIQSLASAVKELQTHHPQALPECDRCSAESGPLVGFCENCQGPMPLTRPTLFTYKDARESARMTVAEAMAIAE